MTGSCATSAASSSGRSSLASQTPMSGRRAARVSRWACHTGSGTMTLPAGTSTVSGVSVSSRRSKPQVFGTTAAFLMISSRTSNIFVFSHQVADRDRRCIDMFLERRQAQALGRIDEALAFVAVAHVDVQQAADDFRHLQGRERWSDDLADGGVVALRAADRHLIPFATILVDAEDADAAHVMVAAGIDAAGNIQFDLADVVLEVDAVEAFRDGGRDRQRLGVRQRAEIAAGAADHV